MAIAGRSLLPLLRAQGVTISENELDGLRFSSYDSETDTAVGTFDFGSSRAETEH